MAIQVLPLQLANQISAGEVVERPGSVVKELLENSIDAGASRIEIEIAGGGVKHIRIRDNGRGIPKEELVLALARHATSKIASLDDLKSITSMGFRGEALASITSVSRLTLTSRPALQSEAWQAYAEGRELAVTLKPAAHPVGTTVDVLDLFYNTPARRKFMRREKTEFTHIDEVIRRIALAHFDITFMLQHNGKTVRQYRAVTQHSQNLRRLVAICGPAFVDRAMELSWQHGDLAIHGWITDPATGMLPVIQYSYVNRRMIRDKLINHAIRQAYQKHLTGTAPAFVLFLDVDPSKVDVNVHPAKHEVRFHQARLVHDFIYQAVETVLQQSAVFLLPIDAERALLCAPKTRQASGRNHFSQPDHPKSLFPLSWGAVASELTQVRSSAILSVDGWRAAGRKTGSDSASPYPESISAGDQHKEHTPCRPLVQPLPLLKKRNTAARYICVTPSLADGVTPPGDNDAPNASTALSPFSVPCEEPLSTNPAITGGNPESFGRVLTLIESSYALVEAESRLALLSLPIAARCLTERQLMPDTERWRTQPLLIPLRMTLSDHEAAALKRYQLFLREMGIALQQDAHQAILHAVPVALRKHDLQNLIPDLLRYLDDKTSVTQQQVATWLACQLQPTSFIWSHDRAIQLLSEIERLYPQWVQSPPDVFMVIVSFEIAIKVLHHD